MRMSISGILKIHCQKKTPSNQHLLNAGRSFLWIFMISKEIPKLKEDIKDILKKEK